MDMFIKIGETGKIDTGIWESIPCKTVLSAKRLVTKMRKEDPKLADIYKPIYIGRMDGETIKRSSTSMHHIWYDASETVQR